MTSGTNYETPSPLISDLWISRPLAFSPLQVGSVPVPHFIPRLGLHCQVWYCTCGFSPNSGVIDAHESLLLDNVGIVNVYHH